MSPNATVTIRKAVASDSAAVIQLILGLAEYEKLDPPDDAAQKRLLNDAFGEHPRFDIYLAEAGGNVCGYAFVFETYSTFLALPTLYLEDIFVMPEYRGAGAGFALFRKCVEEAERRGCGRLDWVVLDWNKLARDFYARLGATHLDNWCNYRLTRDQFPRILTMER
jgi:GNAT superfamily N-acetyltransferase